MAGPWPLTVPTSSTSVGSPRGRVPYACRWVTRSGLAGSTDTMHAETAEAAISAGACLVNDVSGGLADPAMHAAVAGLGVPYVAMHWRGHSDHMDELARYGNVVADVRRELAERAASAIAAGIARERIVLDPGLGFAKDALHNWALLGALPELLSDGFPVLVGASRTRFLGSLLADESGEPRPVQDRDDATDAVTALAAMQGVWAVRVHDVAGSRDAVRVVEAWTGASNGH